MRKRFKATNTKFLFLVMLLLLGVITGTYAWIYPQITRCYFVRLSALDKIASNIFVDPSMSRSQRIRLLENIRLARLRVTELWGTSMAQPAIIATPNRSVFVQYGNDRGSAGTTHLTPLGSYIVLDSAGLNLDVISHELCHAELLERLGWLKREYKIPTWFDEGLAMLLDHRHSFCEEEWMKKTAGGRTAPRLDDIGRRENFWKGSDEQIAINYSTAKHELSRWYKIVGRNGLIRLLLSLNNQESFEQTYKRIEQEKKKKKRRKRLYHTATVLLAR